MVRTRLMNQPPDAKIYSGAVDCVMKILKAEGPTGFYRGFIPIWMRFAPTTCLQVGVPSLGSCDGSVCRSSAPNFNDRCV